MGKKNIQGGNKTKAMARKTTYDNAGTRVPLTPEEKYGIITSVCGSGRFQILSLDNLKFLGILPGSMRGHKKRNHYVALHDLVLFNDRTSWQTIKLNSHADILHVYDRGAPPPYDPLLGYDAQAGVWRKNENGNANANDGPFDYTNDGVAFTDRNNTIAQNTHIITFQDTPNDLENVLENVLDLDTEFDFI